MKQLSIILSLFLYCFTTITAQDSLSVPAPDTLNYKLSAVLKVDASLITTDVLQNIYIVSQEGDLIKYNPKGKELYRFNEFTLGTPTQVDATNPFKVLLYYPDFQTVVTLDNTLSKTGESDLFDLGLDVIETICFSNDGNIWLYDPLTFKVKKIDHNARTLLTSNNLSLLLAAALEPVFLLERENWLFVNDPETGIHLFDVYGEYSRTIEMKGLRNFQVTGKRFVYFKDQKLYSYNLESLDLYVISLPVTEKKINNIRFEKKKLYLALENEVRIYSF